MVEHDAAPNPHTAQPAHSGAPQHAALLATALGAIGVVFGDIGTSPLYTLQVAGVGTTLTQADLYGVISLIVWALILAVSFKYVTVVMRADNRGEGGILALLALLPPRKRDTGVGVISLLVIAGAALLFGDGMITPAISVLSALEGLKLAAPGFAPYVVPLTCVVLIGLFSIQKHGTGHVGKMFGPVMILWFATIGVLGIKELVRDPAVLAALSPKWGALYFAHHGFAGLAILGVVVLAITGGEALYADMGHFGIKPIRLAWFALVLPALLLNYLGQASLVLRNPDAIANPFFAMVPSGILTYAVIGLAALATTIASQALISGVFSLTHQAVQLGYFPRVTVNHTSREAEGQIYLPLLNWGLLFACLALVLGFQESSRLASAYGIAVSGTMAITSIVFFDVTRKHWKWPLWKSLPLLVLFLSFDIPFFAANMTKLFDGGYIPILVGAAFFVMMVNWHQGREALVALLEERTSSVPEFMSTLPGSNVNRVPGTAVYLSPTSSVPFMLVMQADRLRAMAEHIILVTVRVEHEPQVADGERFTFERLEAGFVRVVLRFGYMENPAVPPLIAKALASAGYEVPLDDATYYIGRETFIAGEGGRMRPTEEKLFALLSRNAKSAIDHFGLPAERVIELGIRVDL